MKLGLRTPSPRKAFAARTSPARIVRHSFGFKAPRGAGLLFSPRRASYNFFSRRARFPIGGALSALPSLFILGIIFTYWSVIVFIFWTLVVLSVIWLWLIFRRPPPRKQHAPISIAPQCADNTVAVSVVTPIAHPPWMTSRQGNTVAAVLVAPNEPAPISIAPGSSSKVDYTKWSKAKWKAWEKSHLKQIGTGQKLARPVDISLWTDEERSDWKKEEWLRVAIKNET